MDQYVVAAQAELDQQWSRAAGVTDAVVALAQRVAARANAVGPGRLGYDEALAALCVTLVAAELAVRRELREREGAA